MKAEHRLSVGAASGVILRCEGENSGENLRWAHRPKAYVTHNASGGSVFDELDR